MNYGSTKVVRLPDTVSSNSEYGLYLCIAFTSTGQLGSTSVQTYYVDKFSEAMQALRNKSGLILGRGLRELLCRHCYILYK